jgi:hypothetical protein
LHSGLFINTLFNDFRPPTFAGVTHLKSVAIGSSVYHHSVIHDTYHQELHNWQQRSGIDMSIFEVTMLICFGSAWPTSIYKSISSKTAKGKSIAFLIIVFVGYIAGILHKLFYNLDWVVTLYALNGFMVLVDLSITLRNRELDKNR